MPSPRFTTDAIIKKVNNTLLNFSDRTEDDEIESVNAPA